MSTQAFKLEDFQVEALSKKQQKAVHGGDYPQPVDPSKSGNGGGGNNTGNGAG